MNVSYRTAENPSVSQAGKEDTTDANRASGEATNGENTGNPDQAKGDSGHGKGGASLEDLLRTLNGQINSTDWLKENTAEKWVSENPKLAEEFMEAAKKS